MVRLQAISPEAVNAAITGAKSEAEKAADDLADRLSNKQIDVAEFISQYRQKRQEYHTAAIIEERLKVKPQLHVGGHRFGPQVQKQNPQAQHIGYR